MITLYHIGFYQPYFQESKVWIQYYQNPSFGDKILTIQNLKIPCDPYKIHTQSNFHTKNPKFHTSLGSSLFFFFFFLFLFLFLAFTVFALFGDQFGFKSYFQVKVMFGLQIKPIFGLTFFICKKVPPCLGHLYFGL